ncbi:hypothetical protein IQ249_22535 [Lusitaniella coriacea LEGE 07157]|uniref:Chaperone protein CcmS domain-containing protein n=1 Tax=Lusitaniella coriacea LEGE 07157 TaxID=945747 RepID=A0A8J7DZR5_9CYAN|nr:hypothetical protein [Lusitaniella coriacea]MBE9118671.1 hypothetical protein [Lusitaniella coriacea LEGE 07157]
MIGFGRPQPETGEEAWKYHLDRFARENQQELAALTWGFTLEQEEPGEILGIDLQPSPHFIACSRQAIEMLNRNVNNQLQEILGIVDGYRPEKEALLIAIGEGQIKLINFAPDPLPPDCFEQASEDISTLCDRLEQRLVEEMGDFTVNS